MVNILNMVYSNQTSRKYLQNGYFTQSRCDNLRSQKGDRGEICRDKDTTELKEGHKVGH